MTITTFIIITILMGAITFGLIVLIAYILEPNIEENKNDDEKDTYNRHLF